MNQVQVQEELAIIREMIEKSRKHTAESGHIFIFIGIFWVLVSIGIYILERLGHGNMLWPMMISGLVITVAMGMYIGVKADQKEKVETYARRIFAQTWIGVGISAVLTGVVLPMLEVLPLTAVHFISASLLGVGVYITGALFDLNFIRICGAAWWLAVLLMALIPEEFRFIVMLSGMVIGFILPGFILNLKYRERS